MKDFRPFPRPVEVALPPNATVSADKTALLPPGVDVSSVILNYPVEMRVKGTYSHYGLTDGH